MEAQSWPFQMVDVGLNFELQEPATQHFLLREMDVPPQKMPDFLEKNKVSALLE